MWECEATFDAQKFFFPGKRKRNSDRRVKMYSWWWAGGKVKAKERSFIPWIVVLYRTKERIIVLVGIKNMFIFTTLKKHNVHVIFDRCISLCSLKFHTNQKSNSVNPNLTRFKTGHKLK